MSIAVIILIALAALVIVGLAIAGVVVGRNRPRLEPSSIPPDGTPAAGQPTPGGSLLDQPMTGLESALSQVTDRSGRPLKEHLDAETGHVEELRVVDDTGPLLRRALDHVAGADQTDPPDIDPTAAGVDDTAT